MDVYREGYSLTFAMVSRNNRSRANKWHPGFPADGNWTGADWSNAMCGEAGEAANVVKKLRRHDFALRNALDEDRNVLLAKLADECADVFLYLDLLAQFYGIDLAQAVVKKFNYMSELQGFWERLPEATTNSDECSGPRPGGGANG